MRIGNWQITINARGIRVTPTPLRDCADCHGDGGWWTPGPNPDMDACGCWSDRSELHIPLRPPPPFPNEPPF